MGAHHRPSVKAIAGPWADDAACRTEPITVFFGETPDDEARALATCRACPVIQECRRFAIEQEQHHGVWGGMTERERRPLIERVRSRRQVA